MLNLVVDPREAMLTFAVAVAPRAVDELLVMRRLVVAGHIRFAGELSRGSTARVQAVRVEAVLWFLGIPIPKLVMVLEKVGEMDGKKAIGIS
jgi:hypothetical protein